MVNVEFIFNQKITIIEIKLDEPFQFIIDEYITNILIEPDSVYFIANSKKIESQQTVENYMNDIDKKNNKIILYINFIEHEGYKNEKQTIMKSKCIILTI